MSGRGPPPRSSSAKRAAHFNETNEYQRRENWREIESGTNEMLALAKEAESKALSQSTVENAIKVKALAERLQALAESILANERGTHKRQRKVPGPGGRAQESPDSPPSPSSYPRKNL